MIRVLLADNDELVRAGLSVLLEAPEDVTVVGQAATAREAVEAADRLQPDVVLMEVGMPDWDGIDAIRRISDGGSRDRSVIVVTTLDRDEVVFESLRAGAKGYVLKRSRPDELLEAIRRVAAGEALLSASITRRLIERVADVLAATAGANDALALLTDREREVLTLLAVGSTNAEIAAEMQISESTAKTHLKRVLMKLGLRDRVAAVVFAYEVGIVAPGSGLPPDQVIGQAPGWTEVQRARKTPSRAPRPCPGRPSERCRTCVVMLDPR